MSQSYFIAGTDTGIGKTHIGLALLHAAANAGLSTQGLKPVSAGCEDIDGRFVNEDAWALLQTATIDIDYTDVNPVALAEPMAPHIAAEREGIVLDVDGLARHCQARVNHAEFTVVEGAGGWDVPLNAAETMADLAIAIGSPVVLVVGMRLGCINHALLSVAAIRGSGLPLAGWVANHVDPDMAVPDENVAALQERIAAPLLGRVPWGENPAQTAARLTLPRAA